MVAPAADSEMDSEIACTTFSYCSTQGGVKCHFEGCPCHFEHTGVIPSAVEESIQTDFSTSFAALTAVEMTVGVCSLRSLRSK